MSRPTDWSALDRGADPVPGDPGTVMFAGRRYVGTADAILRAAENLTTALGDEFGQSEAVDAIREQGEEVARRIVRAESRYRDMGDAMMTYAPKLTAAQARSVEALDAAIAARGSGQTADSMVRYWQRIVDDPATPPANLPHATERLSHWTEQASGADTALSGAFSELQAAIGDRDRAADAAYDAIDFGDNPGDLNDGWWDNFSQWVADHKDLLDTIGTVLGAVAAIAGAILLFIPGLNLIVAVILTVIVVANIAYQALNAAAQVTTGNMTLAEGIVNVGLAVLNVVGAGAAIKVAATATRATVATSLMRSFAGRGIAGMTRVRALTTVERLGAVASGARATPLPVKVAAQAIGFDTKALSAVHAMSRVQMLSGAQATGAMRPLLLAAGGTALLGTATSIAENPLADALEPYVPEVNWRVGGNW